MAIVAGGRLYQVYVVGGRRKFLPSGNTEQLIPETCNGPIQWTRVNNINQDVVQRHRAVSKRRAWSFMTMGTMPQALDMAFRTALAFAKTYRPAAS
jgi:hypothetical protein